MQKKRREKFQTEIIAGSAEDNKKQICPYTKIAFIPKNRKQKYLNKEARIKFNNEKRSTVNKERNDLFEKITSNNKILEKGLKQFEKSGKKTIGKDALEFSGYDFSVCSGVTKNNFTGTDIYWAVNHGIEKIKSERDLYTIHRK